MFEIAMLIKDNSYFGKQEKKTLTSLTHMSNILNVLIVFCSKMIVALFTFATGIIIARHFGPSGKGTYDLFLTITSLIVTVGSLGIGMAFVYLVNKQKKDPVKLVSNSLTFGVIWGLFLNILFYVIFLLFPNLLSDLPLKYIFLGFLVIPFTLLHIYLLPFFLAKFQMLKWAISLIFYSSLILLGTIFSISILHIGMDGAIYAVVLSGIFTFFLIILFIIKTTPLKINFHKSLFIQELRFGLKSHFGDIFSLINLKISLLFVNVLAGIVAVGYYSVTINIISVIFFIPFSFRQVLYSTWSLSKDEKVNQNTVKVAHQALIVGVVSALFLSLIGKFFINFFYGEEFYPAFPLLLWSLPGFIFMNFANIFFNNFFAKGKPYITTITLGIALITNVVLGSILIPISTIGLIGAPISTSVSFLVAALISILVFSRESGCSTWKIIKVSRSDLIDLYFNFRSVFRSKKMLEIVPGLDIDKLKSYYERKATDSTDIISSSFDSRVIYKKLFYSSRVNKILELLDVKDKERVLEIGCGSGYYTKKIAEISSNLVATDISQNYINKAKSYNPHKVLAYLACPIEKMPFPDNHFDKVLMSEVIEHLISAEDGIKEAWRVLRPGGKMVIATPNKYSYLNILYHLKVTFRGNPFDQEHIKEFSGEELVGLLKKYFVVEKVYYVNFFPVFIPGFIIKKIGFLQIDKFIQRVEIILNKIPLIRKIGFSTIVRVAKI